MRWDWNRIAADRRTSATLRPYLSWFRVFILQLCAETHCRPSSVLHRDVCYGSSLSQLRRSLTNLGLGRLRSIRRIKQRQPVDCTPPQGAYLDDMQYPGAIWWLLMKLLYADIHGNGNQNGCHSINRSFWVGSPPKCNYTVLPIIAVYSPTTCQANRLRTFYHPGQWQTNISTEVYLLVDVIND